MPAAEFCARLTDNSTTLIYFVPSKVHGIQHCFVFTRASFDLGLLLVLADFWLVYLLE